jgi:bifunctional UDP-N-acetylglucosamine pyrophosphorylase / glucosamine-1-phosphate N-acetyltransferase
MAAGEATGMRSTRPKALHRLCGRPMLLHVLDALTPLDLERAVVVVGYGAERISKTLQQEVGLGGELRVGHLEFVTQEVRRGTGDAVAVALTAFPADELDDDADGDLLVVPGDVPLLRSETLAALVFAHREADAAVTVLTAKVEDPRGLGRIVHAKGGRIRHIVEESDASLEELALTEVNTSVYCFKRSLLGPALRRLSPENSQRKYHLTDVISVLFEAGYNVVAHPMTDPTEADGVNDRIQLAHAEEEMRRRTNLRLMESGVTMIDPSRTYVDASVRVDPDVTLFPGVILQGTTVVEAGAEIGPDTRLVDTFVGEGAVVEKSVARSAEIGAGAVVGPFAALEPGARLAPGVRTGAHFVG